jgi:hypothetical protein
MPAALEYALFWHGLIPERVYEATSVCMRRSRVFDNALGRFSYVTVPPSLFPVGMRQEQASERETFLIAGPEKALCDKVLLTRNLQARSRIRNKKKSTKHEIRNKAQNSKQRL